MSHDLSLVSDTRSLLAEVISVRTPGKVTPLPGQLKRNLGCSEIQHMRKWQRSFLNCFEGKRLIFIKTEFFNLCQDGTDTSGCSRKS
jgi:hypothetical protein